MNDIKSRDARYFEQLYRCEPDPWRFKTSPYEQAKYAATLAALGQRRFRQALEVGCSIGVLTYQLADQCETILGIDIAATPLRDAETYCRDRPQISFRQMAVPVQWPAGSFDLIILSEVLYFLAPTDIEHLARRVTNSLAQAGFVLLVHWLGDSDNPCTGDEATDIFVDASQPKLSPVLAQRAPEYRLELLQNG